MDKKRLNNEVEVEAAGTLFPVMASALIEKQGGEENALLMNALLMLVQEQVEKKQKEKEKKERMALSAAQAAKEYHESVAQRQNACNHRKQDDTTRLHGQRLSNGQLNLVCVHCQKTFFHPPIEGQNPIPRELMPHSDSIGG